VPASARLIIAAAALLGACAVACGAFGAHALKSRVSADSLALWQTAAQYHFWHALALFGAGLLAIHVQRPLVTAAAVLFAIGIALFSGSLYALALGAPRALGVATPAGGLAFIAAWVCLLAAVVQA
jgi:uncharacterized membrane protein YgdD (TMEM256/DUF423 family)